MHIHPTGKGLLLTGVSCFDPQQTLDCGQCFRFSSPECGVWHGVAAGRPLTLRTVSEGFLFEGIGPEEFDRVWRPYFDFDRDYETVWNTFPAHPLLEEITRFSPGIRVLRQDGWEALVSFIISQNNNVPRIKGIIDRLCTAFGEPCGEGGEAGFPTPEALACRSEADMAVLRAGWRAGYILDAARRVASGALDLKKVENMPLDEARAALRTVRGVGPKVAECVLLYGMGRLEAFPMDVWMKRAMAVLFPGMTPSDFGPYAGIAQQYIFHYCRCHPLACQSRRQSV